MSGPIFERLGLLHDSTKPMRRLGAAFSPLEPYLIGPLAGSAHPAILKRSDSGAFV